MPAKNKTLTIYPDPKALAIVGGNSPACNRAIECWAHMLREADLSALERRDWNFLADILNATISDENWSATYLLAELEDAITLNGTDWRWYGTEKEQVEQATIRAAGSQTPTHPSAKRLLEIISGYDYAQIHAILAAVSFFWEHTEIDAQASEWWTPRFRIEYSREEVSK